MDFYLQSAVALFSGLWKSVTADELNFDALPNELINKIFSEFSVKEMSKLFLVCKRFKVIQEPASQRLIFENYLAKVNFNDLTVFKKNIGGFAKIEDQKELIDIFCKRDTILKTPCGQLDLKTKLITIFEKNPIDFEQQFMWKAFALRTEISKFVSCIAPFLLPNCHLEIASGKDEGVRAYVDERGKLTLKEFSPKFNCFKHSIAVDSKRIEVKYIDEKEWQN